MTIVSWTNNPFHKYVVVVVVAVAAAAAAAAVFNKHVSTEFSFQLLACRQGSHLTPGVFALFFWWRKQGETTNKQTSNIATRINNKNTKTTREAINNLGKRKTTCYL